MGGDFELQIEDEMEPSIPKAKTEPVEGNCKSKDLGVGRSLSHSRTRKVRVVGIVYQKVTETGQEKQQARYVMWMLLLL